MQIVIIFAIRNKQTTKFAFLHLTFLVMGEFSISELNSIGFALECMIERLQKRISDKENCSPKWREYFTQELENYLSIKNKVDSLY